MTNRQCLYIANSLNTFSKDSQTAAAAATVTTKTITTTQEIQTVVTQAS
jgi:hypothetical protein